MSDTTDDATRRTDADDCCTFESSEAASDETPGDRPDADASPGDRFGDDAIPGHWLGEDVVLETRLPAELRSTLGDFLGTESVETLGAFVQAIRSFAGNGPLAVQDLCHADGETDHWGELDGERYHFQCFYDAVIMAALRDRPVDVHTVSPDGTVVEARAVGSDELSVSPDDAVFSFGIAADAGDRSGGDPSMEDGYAAICPYVKAFPSYDAYERWSESVPAPTVAMPLADATALADAFAGA